MTFIEEELEAVEKTPQYRRVLKVLLKYQIYTLCQRLSEVGEESYVVTANVSDGTFSHLGSRKGENYLEKLHDAEWKFLSFCSSRGADDQPQEFEELPEQSQQYEDVSQAYEENTEEAEQDPSDFDSRDAPSEEVDDGNSAETHYTRISIGRVSHVHQSRGSKQSNRYNNDQHNLDKNISSTHYQEAAEHSEDWNSPQTKPNCNTESLLVKTIDGHNEFQVKVEPEFKLADCTENQKRFRSVSFGKQTTSPLNVGDVSVGKWQYDTFMSTDSRPIENIPVFEQTGTTTSPFTPVSSDGTSFIGPPKIETGQSAMITSGYPEEEGSNDGDILFHECPVCNKRFPYASHLTVHLRSHITKGSHQCPVCFKTFKQSSNLYVHQRLHTGERPFRCTICDKSFVQANTLTFHMRKHTGDKPYRCSYCGKAFIQSSGLNSHMRLHYR